MTQIYPLEQHKAFQCPATNILFFISLQRLITLVPAAQHCKKTELRLGYRAFRSIGICIVTFPPV